MRLRLIIFWIVLFITYAFSNKSKIDFQNTSYSNSKIQIQVFSPYLAHSILLNGEKGFSGSYLYPGFYNGNTGEMHLYYTTLSQDSYNFGIGLFNLHIGANKKIFSSEKNNLYLNGMYGFTIDNPISMHSMASIGISNKIINLRRDFNMELSFDGFIHSGTIQDILPKIAYSRGLVAMILCSHIYNKFVIGYGIGFSITQYRYDDNDANKRSISYENEIDNFPFSINPKWKTYLIIPFGISISYKF
jgi:hypothetical protein